MNVELQTAWSPLVGLLVALALVLVLVWSYRWLRGKARDSRRRLFLGLRIAAALLLLLLAMKPVLRADRLQAEDARVVVLLDTSGSMATPDSYDDRPRYDVAADLLFADGGLVEVIEDEIPISVLRFDEAARPEEPDRLVERTPDGELTDLAGALRALASRGGRTAAVVLVSDGAHNAGGDVREAAASLPSPVFAIGLGRPAGARKGAKDLEISGVEAPETALVNNAVLAEVTIRSSGYDLTDGANRRVTVKLMEGKVDLETREVELSEDGLPVRVDMKAVPSRVGTFTYRVEIVGRGDEINAENNARTFTVEALDRRIAVLYVEGAARWEYKWIKTALQRDPAIQFMGMIATGRGAYLVQGEKTTTDLSQGLPRSAEGYEPLDVVVLGDIGAASFDEETIRRLRDFVDAGGGLLALGGYQAFAAGGWGETALADCLPVVLPVSDEPQIERPFAPEVTAEGRNDPILAGLVELFEASPRPTLEGCSPLGRVKPQAATLLQNPDGGTPVLVVGRFGEGRVAAFAGDTTYRWALGGRSGDGGGLHERFFGQIVRGLFSPEEAIEKTGDAVAIWTDGRVARRHEEVRVRARVRDDKGGYVDGAVVTCEAMGPGRRPQSLTFVAAPRLRGHYEARFRPDRPGEWILSGEARSGETVVGFAGTRINVSPESIESDDTGIRDDVLRDVAAASGGRYYPLPKSGRIPADILATLRDEMIREETDLWNAPLLFLLFTGLLAAEWVLRKRSHLL